jgi:cytolysin-activating lysine-acyltransferase
MFGRSKSKAPSAPSVSEAAGDSSTRSVGKAAPANAMNGKSAAATEVPTAALPNQAARQRAAIAVRHSLAFAQIVSLLMRSAQHKRYPIGALEWLVIPPLLTGQFSIAEARSKQSGASAPVAVALWAKVSPEVDKRLSEDLDKPMLLRPREWRSGDILWLVEVIGDARVLPQLLTRLSESTFKGREVKVRRRGTDGKVTVTTLKAMV